MNEPLERGGGSDQQRVATLRGLFTEDEIDTLYGALLGYAPLNDEGDVDEEMEEVAERLRRLLETV